MFLWFILLYDSLGLCSVPVLEGGVGGKDWKIVYSLVECAHALLTAVFHLLFSFLRRYCALKTIIMPRVSAKRKAYCESRRQCIVKRYKKDDNQAGLGSEGGSESHVEGGSESHVGGSESVPSTSHVFPKSGSNHVSSASYRHSLLPEKHRKAEQVNENSTITSMSVQRLLDLLQFVTCPDCGKKNIIYV